MIKFFLKLFILIKNVLPHLGREGGIRRGRCDRVRKMHTTMKAALLYTKGKRTTIVAKEHDPPKALRLLTIPRSRLRSSILNVGRNYLHSVR